MFVDSHCHLTFPDLAGRVAEIREAMAQAQVDRALCICTTLHPDNEGIAEPSIDDLVERSRLPKVVAIGETGLDYYQMQERKGGRAVSDMEWQRERFRTHIRAARRVGKPLIIHTRAASADTLAILKEEGEDGSAGSAGGVFHCFTETAEVARAALDMGFYISFSGIVTFKSAQDLRDVAAFVPQERLLIETDSPYLAPVPHRGKINNPSYVPHVAQQLALVRQVPVQAIANLTSDNFERLFLPQFK